MISYKKVKFTLHVFVLRDDFSERINRVIRGFAVLGGRRGVPLGRNVARE
jgi:hypothetical protein